MAEPVCDCYPGGFTPDSFEGPKEDCPVHGRRAYLSDEDMSDLDNVFSPGLSSGMSPFDLVERIVRREIAAELDRLAEYVQQLMDRQESLHGGKLATWDVLAEVLTVLEGRVRQVRNG